MDGIATFHLLFTLKSHYLVVLSLSAKTASPQLYIYLCSYPLVGSPPLFWGSTCTHPHKTKNPHLILEEEHTDSTAYLPQGGFLLKDRMNL